MAIIFLMFVCGELLSVHFHCNHNTTHYHPLASTFFIKLPTLSTISINNR